jgi:hypothetical protein
MSVSFPVIDYLDPINNRIYLLAGTRDYHPVEDIYTEMRNIRRLDDTLRWFDMPVQAAGNVPKGGGKYTPRYAIFNNGWKVVPEDITHDLLVSGEQITDDGQSGKACMELTTLSPGVNVFIQYEPPSAEIVRDEVSLAAIEFMSFSNMVTVDTINGISGTTYPAGNTQYPSDNNLDAYDIALNRNINHMHFKHVNTITAPLALAGFILSGDSPVTTSLHLDSAAIVDNCEIVNLTVSGVLDGGTILRECNVNGVQYFNGAIKNCGITALPVVLGGTANGAFINCYSVVPGGNARPQIDFNHEQTGLAIRDWHGGIELVNKTVPEGDVSIDMSSGIIYIRSSCTAGEITVRGLGRLVDESGPDCVVKYEGLLDPAYVQYMTFSEHVWVDESTSNTGDIYPVGSPTAPVNNWADALLISEKYGIDRFKFHGVSTLPAGIIINDKVIQGVDLLDSIITVQDTAKTGNCEFLDCQLTGYLDPLGSNIVRESMIYDLHNFSGFLSHCSMSGDLFLGGGQNTVLENCFQGYVNADNVPPLIDMGSTGQSLAVRGYFGAIKLCNLDDPLKKIVCDIASGVIFLCDTLTQGNIVLRGIGEVRDLGHTADLSVNQVISTPIIATAVWNEPIADHVIANTTGHSVYHTEYQNTVVIDEVNGISGTTYPIGTHHVPSDNWVDALAIKEAHNYQSINVHSDTTVPFGVDVSGIEIYGNGSSKSTITFAEGCINDLMRCHDAGITGKMGLTNVLMQCGIKGITNFSGLMHECILYQLPIVLSAATPTMIDSSAAFNLVPTPIPIDCDNGAVRLSLTGFKGGVAVSNMDIGSYSTFLMAAGMVKLDSSCVNGNVTIGGIVNKIVDESGELCIVDFSDAIHNKNTEDFVWNATMIDHTDSGTTGNSLSTASSGGVDLGLMADAIWDHSTGNKIRASVEGKAIIIPQEDESKIVNVYDADDNTILYTFIVSADNNLRVPA